MDKTKIGYACINMTLKEKGVMTNRDAVKKNLYLERFILY